MSSEDIVSAHDTPMKSLGTELSDDDKRLPYKCTTKQLSSLLTKILTVIKIVV